VGELGGRDEKVLHVQRRGDLDAGARHTLAAVGELVHAAGRHDDCLARLGDDGAQAEAELHGALEHLEGLLLLRVHVRTGDAPVGSERELELEELAVGVGRGAHELDALAADGVLDDLSRVGHVRLRSSMTPGHGRRGCK
jgi:hypothetical protein